MDNFINHFDFQGHFVVLGLMEGRLSLMQGFLYKSLSITDKILILGTLIPFIIVKFNYIHWEYSLVVGL